MDQQRRPASGRGNIPERFFIGHTPLGEEKRAIAVPGREGVRFGAPRAYSCRAELEFRRRDQMPQTQHIEKHFTASETIRDVVIGMSDGLTVPFALAAGLSGAVDSTRVVITAGLAEIAAGSIAMGLGGYLAARTDAEHYASERAREIRETVEIPEEEKREVAEVFQHYGLPDTLAQEAAHAISKNRKRWIDFMMRFELGLEEPDPRRARTSALTIALSYVAGGLVPLAPYFFFRKMGTALQGSIVVTLAALLLFGYVKGRFTVKKPFKSAWQTAVVGGLAAAAAFAIAKFIA